MKTRTLLNLSEFAKSCIIANECKIKLCKMENTQLKKRIQENLGYIEQYKQENREMKNRI